MVILKFNLKSLNVFSRQQYSVQMYTKLSVFFYFIIIYVKRAMVLEAINLGHAKMYLHTCMDQDKE